MFIVNKIEESMCDIHISSALNYAIVNSFADRTVEDIVYKKVVAPSFNLIDINISNSIDNVIHSNIKHNSV